MSFVSDRGLVMAGDYWWLEISDGWQVVMVGYKRCQVQVNTTRSSDKMALDLREAGIRSDGCST